MPLKLLPCLRKKFPLIDFIELDPTETLPEEERFIILDTVINTDKVVLLNDIDKLAMQPNYSLHDFDLGFSLKLMKKLGRIKDVTIIGIPPVNKETSLKELERIIPSLFSGSAKRS